ncbi:MAG: hypothetical protein K6A05_01800 [Lachnospiraceae bacterium]|nr:hypothetical protein [Lachnospiraceae bacterium]
MASRDLALEQKELQAISYIRKNIDLSDRTVVEKVYRQLTEQNTLQTQVGKAFLDELNAILYPEAVPQMMQYKVVQADGEVYRDPQGERLYTKQEVLTELRKLKNIEKGRVQLLTVSTVILGIMVVAMLAISLTSKLPTIVNYKSMVTDEYASWETQLRTREDAVRKREQELLEKETDYVERLNRLEQQTTYQSENMDALDEGEEDMEAVDNGEE